VLLTFGTYINTGTGTIETAGGLSGSVSKGLCGGSFP
jgi:hypothetical protein